MVAKRFIMICSVLHLISLKLQNKSIKEIIFLILWGRRKSNHPTHRKLKSFHSKCAPLILSQLVFIFLSKHMSCSVEKYSSKINYKANFYNAKTVFTLASYITLETVPEVREWWEEQVNTLKNWWSISSHFQLHFCGLSLIIVLKISILFWKFSNPNPSSTPHALHRWFISLLVDP
jgi:hypothetical protein